MKKRFLEIYEQIDKLKDELLKLQAKCKHKHVEKKYTSDDDYPRSYFTNFHCLDCDKHWNEDGTK